MLIVEGPDGSGKTTLVEKLAEQLEWLIHPKLANHDTTLNINLGVWCVENRLKGFQEVIYDRYPLISEPIYGSVLRGYLRDGLDDGPWFRREWKRWQALQPLVVVCLPPLEVVMQNLRDDENNLEVVDKQPLIYWQYWALLQRSEWPWIHFDYTQTRDVNGSVSLLCDSITMHVRRIQRER